MVLYSTAPLLTTQVHLKTGHAASACLYFSAAINLKPGFGHRCVYFVYFTSGGRQVHIHEGCGMHLQHMSERALLAGWISHPVDAVKLTL